MSVKLYMDEHVDVAITRGLRKRNVDVITAQEDGRRQCPDPELLNRATAMDRVLFTQDRHLLQQAASRQRAGTFFRGVIFARQISALVGRYTRDLELICQCCDVEEFENRVEYLPLK